ncbi:MAG TPA: hypothetical protein VGJ44_26550, partial [Kribbellaceae bacterium]
MPNHTISPGTLLAGRYRIGEQLAEFGGARIWRAVDEVLSRPVVVDVIPSDDPRAGRLTDAARRAAMAADSRFLRVLDCSAYDGLTYCVREWAAGRSLERMLGNGPLTGQQAGWLTREVSEALELLHRSGQPHGSINPATVVVTDAGAIKIVGVATEAALRRADGPGSPAEDVRDLGRVLYACLTARYPGGPAFGMQAAPLENGRLMSPRQVRAGVPRSLDDIADRLLGAPPRHHSAPISSAAGLSAALAGVIGHSHEPPAQISDETVAMSRQGSVDDATQLSPAITTPPAVNPYPGVDPSPYPAVDPNAYTQVQRPVATAGAPTTMTPRPVASPPPNGQRPVQRQSADGGGGDRTPYGTIEKPRRGGWGGRILILLAVLALLSVIAMAQFLIKPAVTGDDKDTSKDAKSTPSSSAPVSKTIEIVGFRDVDPKPQGSGEEHHEDVPKTFDGKVDTTWTTMSYNSAAFGDEKPGVG